MATESRILTLRNLVSGNELEFDLGQEQQFISIDDLKRLIAKADAKDRNQEDPGLYAYQRVEICVREDREHLLLSSCLAPTQAGDDAKPPVTDDGAGTELEGKESRPYAAPPSGDKEDADFLVMAETDRDMPEDRKDRMSDADSNSLSARCSEENVAYRHLLVEYDRTAKSPDFLINVAEALAVEDPFKFYLLPSEPFPDRATLDDAVIALAGCSFSPREGDPFWEGFFRAFPPGTTAEEIQNESRAHLREIVCVRGPFVSWNVSLVPDVSELFRPLPWFNENIADWRVGGCTRMTSLFDQCSEFNSDISHWDVSCVTDMSYMFDSCSRFNQPIGSWNVANVQRMESMFAKCREFDQPLGGWDVSSVQTMTSMFYDCVKFNQDLSSWDVRRVRDFSYMFNGDHLDSLPFDGDISGWQVHENANVFRMLIRCANFSHTLAQWPRHQREKVLKDLADAQEWLRKQLAQALQDES
ncbi:unnamed protein product [Amoebophrya sp. A120]|nr:unnamed protein product [Amoebophrya sp. A120]|eukprot:GSA120T00025061001.1